MKKFLGIFLVVLMICGCSEKKELSVLGDWEIRFFEKDGVSQKIALSTISVDENVEKDSEFNLSGFSAVNYFMAKVFKTKTGIAFSPTVMTKMAGNEEEMAFENNFIEFLTNANSWKVEEVDGLERLEIENTEENSKISFSRISLIESNWRLIAINNGDAVVSVDENSKILLNFIDKKNVSASTGLNILGTEWTLDEKKHKLSFKEQNGIMTLAAGAEEEMETERLFIENLNKTETYAISGKELTLYSGEKEMVLVFERVDKV